MSEKSAHSVKLQTEDELFSCGQLGMSTNPGFLTFSDKFPYT
jgi:hypothetical protein